MPTSPDKRPASETAGTPAQTQPAAGHELKLLSEAQKRALRWLVFGCVLVLAGSLYLAAVTVWQDVAQPRVRLHAFYQGMLLFHFAAGTLVCVGALLFAFWHLRAAWRRRRFSTVCGGTLAAIGSAALLVSGFVMLREGNAQGSTAVFHIHQAAGVVALLAYVAHRQLAYTPTPRAVFRRTTVSTLGLFLLAGAVHTILAWLAPPLPERAPSAFAEIDISSDPFIPFRPLGSPQEDSPFAPARTTTASGTLIDPSLLYPGEVPDAEALASAVEEHGFAAEHAIGAEDCRVCHADVVAQWEGSAHRFSSFNNPFYTASIETLRKERGPDAAKFCGGCHDPAVLLSGGFEDEGPLETANLAAQTGLSCMACHGMHRIHDVTGNGNWELADDEEDPYLFAGAKEGWQLWLRKYLIKARPRDHRVTLKRDFFSSSEYCVTCHKVSVGQEINNYKWLRGQDEYDAWHASGVARNAAATFYLPKESKSCQDCHMPLEQATRGDMAAKEGMVRSHRFPSANTALPFVRGDEDMLERAEAEMSNERLRVDIFALDHPRLGFVIDPTNESIDLRGGDELIAYVVVRNLGVGHTFPGGTNDSNEGWLRFEARTPEGEIIAISGELSTDGSLDPEAHRYGAVMLDANSDPILEREVHDFHTAGLVRTIGPGTADIARYRIVLPEGEKALILSAKLEWRKFTRAFTQFSHEALGLEVPDLPVTTMASGTVQVSTLSSPPSPAEWQRFNDLGIGLLLQGDVRRALAAFERVQEVAPDRPDGFRNQARAHLAEGTLEPVSALLDAADQHAAGPEDRTLTALWRAKWREARGEPELAEKLYQDVLEVFDGDRATWLLLADLRFDLRDFEGALEAALEVLRIDPESAPAHYRRMLVYRALGEESKEREARKAFDTYRVDDEAQQIVQRWRLDDPAANREIDPLHVH